MAKKKNNNANSTAAEEDNAFLEDVPEELKVSHRKKEKPLKMEDAYGSFNQNLKDLFIGLLSKLEDFKSQAGVKVTYESLLKVYNKYLKGKTAKINLAKKLPLKIFAQVVRENPDLEKCTVEYTAANMQALLSLQSKIPIIQKIKNLEFIIACLTEDEKHDFMAKIDELVRLSVMYRIVLDTKNPDAKNLKKFVNRILKENKDGFEDDGFASNAGLILNILRSPDSMNDLRGLLHLVKTTGMISTDACQQETAELEEQGQQILDEIANADNGTLLANLTQGFAHSGQFMSQLTGQDTSIGLQLANLGLSDDQNKSE